MNGDPASIKTYIVTQPKFKPVESFTQISISQFTLILCRLHFFKRGKFDDLLFSDVTDNV